MVWPAELVQPDKTDLMPPDRLTHPLTDVLPHMPSVLSLSGSFLLARRTLKMLTFSSCPFVGVLSSETQDACRSCWWRPGYTSQSGRGPLLQVLEPSQWGRHPWGSQDSLSLEVPPPAHWGAAAVHTLTLTHALTRTAQTHTHTHRHTLTHMQNTTTSSVTPTAPVSSNKTRWTYMNIHCPIRF